MQNFVKEEKKCRLFNLKVIFVLVKQVTSTLYTHMYEFANLPTYTYSDTYKFTHTHTQTHTIMHTFLTLSHTLMPHTDMYTHTHHYMLAHMHTYIYNYIYKANNPQTRRKFCQKMSKVHYLS